MKKQKDSAVLIVVKQGILEISLNRPNALNALNGDVMHQLYDAFAHAKEDPDIKALLITGVGKAFCAGADINQLATLDSQTGIDFAHDGQMVFRTLEQLGKPSLAVINGFALGGGCELAMAATLRIAADTAMFGQPEVKLGVIPGFGGTQRLTRLVGKGRALDMCLTGRMINAEEALHWGLVTEVVDAKKLLSRARELLLDITKLAPIALKNIIAVVDRGFDLSLDDALELEALYFGLCCATQDKQEGVKAFFAKRKAEFIGA